MPSQWEILFARQVQEANLPPPEREYRFAAPARQWRFDFAWPAYLVATEIEGAVFTRGRHTRGVGFTKDCEKYDFAAEEGWRIFRYPSSMVESGAAIKQICRVIMRAYGRDERKTDESDD